MALDLAWDLETDSLQVLVPAQGLEMAPELDLETGLALAGVLESAQEQATCLLHSPYRRTHFGH